MSDELDLPAERFRQMAIGALELVERYYAELPGMPVMPVTTAQAVREILHEFVPEEGVGIAETLAVIRDVVYPLSRHNGHPRFFGYVASPGTPVAPVGDMLTAALNANVTSWRSAPAAAAMELLVIDWLKAMIGYDPAAQGLFVSGGSMANFSALAAARTAAEPEIGRSGNMGKPPLRIYVSGEAHFSIHKAARLMGIGSDNVVSVATDALLRIDTAELERRIQADLHAGLTPMCIVANAGTVNTGAVDSLEELADIAGQHDIWLHADGAYGALAALAPSAKALFVGMERADSVSLDPHKWLYSSVGCGCVLYRDARAAIAAFSQEAEYTRPIGLSNEEAFAFWDLGPELSRPFRALTIWLQIKLYGIDRIGDAIESNLACARYFGTLIDAEEEFELLAPVGLSVFCFRCHPRAYTGDLDALNERILTELQRDGSSYLSNARIHGKFALRGCVLNHRTELGDMDRLLEDVRKVSRAVLQQSGFRVL
jgi:aromatic-L-amino-acid decarboxylase